MSDRRRRAKGRRGDGRPFFALYREILRSPEWATLSAHAVKLICDLGQQYRGYNNGDLCATWSMMKKCGWRSPATLNRALKELRARGFAELSRQGGRHMASLYALTFFPINDCDGKLDIPSAKTPTHAWRKNTFASPVVN